MADPMWLYCRMRNLYRVLAYVIAAEVAIQGAVIAFGVAGLGKWVEGGGVLDKSVMESDQSPFPEIAGFLIHGINGMMVIPVLALLLLIASFFTRVPGALAWAGGVLGLVAVQVVLGLFGHGIPVLGGLHGLNALLLFGVAVVTGHRIRRDAVTSAGPIRVDTAAHV